MSRIKTFIKRSLRQAGYDIFSVPRAPERTSGGHFYAEVRPRATLSPWLSNTDFLIAFESVKDDTLLDAYRLFELWSLVEETAKVGGDIVEVGVWRGGSGCLMAYREKLLQNKGIIHLCDTFCGVVKAGTMDSGYRGGEHANTSSKCVEHLADRLSLENIQIHPGVFPDETGNSVDATSIRLLHIDVDVYQSAKDTVDFLWDRIPSGGVVVFDDYGFVGCEGITEYVHELRKSKDCCFVHNLNGHAILVKY